MIKLLLGQESRDKENQMVKIANERIKALNGDCVYISYNSLVLPDLNRRINLISLSSYFYHNDLNSDILWGFINGIIAMNHDLEMICIQNTIIEGIPSFLEKLQDVSETFDIKFYVSVDVDKAENRNINLSSYEIIK